MSIDINTKLRWLQQDASEFRGGDARVYCDIYGDAWNMPKGEEVRISWRVAVVIGGTPHRRKWEVARAVSLDTAIDEARRILIRSESDRKALAQKVEERYR